MTIVQKYLSYLRYEKNYSLHTEISYSKDLDQFREFIGRNFEGISLAEVHGDMVRQWLASLMAAGMNPLSVNRKLSSLKSFYKYLLKIGEIKNNPVKKITGPKTNKPIPSFVNYPDMERVLDSDTITAENNFEYHRNRAIIELLYVTGMRRAELINLKDMDIDLSSDLILVNGKRNKQRLIPFGESTRWVIECYLSERKKELGEHSEYFFVKKDGKPLYPMLVYRIVHENLKWIPTLEKASPHVLRHSFATGMLNNGAELNAVKELLGHSSLASTEVYTHTSFEELKKIYKKAHPRN